MISFFMLIESCNWGVTKSLRIKIDNLEFSFKQKVFLWTHEKVNLKIVIIET